jgi:hypothetical protein
MLPVVEVPAVGLLLLDILAAGLTFELVDMLVAGEVAVTGLMTGEEAGATLVLGLVVLALFAASPQAMPRAPRPRTVESRITFFIVFLQTPVFSQRIKFSYY